jgi:AbrB family looped-hinge helix DNA binding protein
MTSAITMDSAGRIVLPSEVRRRLNLQPGARLRWSVLAERIELTPEVQADTEFAASPSRRKVLPATGKAFDAAGAVREERASQARRRKAR